MNTGGILLWGFVSTLVLTTIMSGSQRTGLTRMNLPYMLGTMLTPDRDRAKLFGFVMHFVIGWLFASMYTGIFQSLGLATWWIGTVIGLIHGLSVLVAGITLLPSLHPRMASEERGPTPTRQLEPPGFMALNYGRRTPISIIIAHLIYGAILGAFYQPV